MPKQDLHKLMQEMNHSLKEEGKLNKDYRKRLDRHIEVYENNGKELARLATAVEEMHGKQDAMYKVYQGFNWSTKAIMWVLGLVATIFGIVLTIKQILIK